MAAVTKDAAASMDASTGMFAAQITGLLAGEAIAAADACYIKNADGKVWKALGTAANEAAVLGGFAAKAAAVGSAVTLFSLGARFRYGTSLSLGAKLYLGLVAGQLDTAAQTGDAVGVAQVITATDIRITRAI